MVQRVQRFRNPVRSNTWLDVGPGNGALILTAAEFGYKTLAIDLREDVVKGLRLFGVQTRQVDIAELDDVEKFSVISFSDVLEHMPFPKNGLLAARRLLEPNGVLLLSLPNMDSAIWRAMDAANSNPFWGELEHFHNFTRTRLYALLSECGFQHYEYGISERYRACMEVIAHA